ncbi:MAG TPA: ATP synthase subunit I [Azospira sp.]|nr:ATP synthase subunit I [Azospira sp.]
MFRAIYFQLLATVIVAALAGTFVGWRGAVSAALGGAATMLPNFLFALRLAIAARKPGGPGVAAFFIGEFVKVAATVGLLALAAKQYADLHWLSLLIGLVVALQASFLAFWKKS